MAAFDGFPRETIAFLTDLGANNEKAWFEAHRAGYERCFVDPALALVEALAPVAATLTPPHKAEARLNGSLRRIHRDVRFSKDKTPYNPQIHLIFWTGSHPNRSAGIHLVLGPQGLGYGAGHWAFEPDALARYRAALGDPEKRHALEDALRKAAAVGCTLGELRSRPCRRASTAARRALSCCATRALSPAPGATSGSTSACSRPGARPGAPGS